MFRNRPSALQIRGGNRGPGLSPGSSDLKQNEDSSPPRHLARKNTDNTLDVPNSASRLSRNADSTENTAVTTTTTGDLDEKIRSSSSRMTDSPKSAGASLFARLSRKKNGGLASTPGPRSPRPNVVFSPILVDKKLAENNYHATPSPVLSLGGKEPDSVSTNDGSISRVPRNSALSSDSVVALHNVSRRSSDTPVLDDRLRRKLSTSHAANRLLTVLETTHKRNMLRDYLEEIHAEESILLWDSLMQRYLEPMPEVRAQQAINILETYLIPSAPKQVNLMASTGEKMGKLHMNKDMEELSWVEVFDDVVDEVFADLRRSATFAKYCKDRQSSDGGGEE